MDAGTVLGQNYPSRPIRLLTSGSGGGNDFNARVIANSLTGVLKQQVIVDNRPTVVSAGENTAHAAPDGYTLLYYGSNVYLLPFLRNNVPYEPLRDFAPITLAVSMPTLLVVHPSLPVKTVKDLIALARARPGDLNYSTGTTGTASYFAAELFRIMAKVNMLNVPYRSGGQQIPDLLSGRLQLTFIPAATVAPLIKAGKLRGVAVTSSKRSILVPELPTIAESGLPGYESVASQGVFAPAKTPAAIITLINREVVRALNEPDVKQKLLNSGVEPVGTTPEQFGEFMKSDSAKMGKLIKDLGIHED
jgi:tripartite-type tricarboxylate transporter receptor subunit TctC